MCGQYGDVSHEQDIDVTRRRGAGRERPRLRLLQLLPPRRPGCVCRAGAGLPARGR